MRNVVTLGGNVKAYGVIGDDSGGNEMKKLFESYDIDPANLSIDKSRRTTQKERIIASAQQLLRVDFEDTEKLDDVIRQEMVIELKKLIDSEAIDAIIFEDYGKGVLNEEMLNQIIACAKEKNIITA